MEGTTNTLPAPRAQDHPPCTAVQLLGQRVESIEKDQTKDNEHNEKLFDKIFERFDKLQWWIIGTLVTALLGVVMMVLSFLINAHK